MTFKKFNQIFISFNKLFFSSVFIYDQKAVSITKTHFEMIHKSNTRFIVILYRSRETRGYTPCHVGEGWYQILGARVYSTLFFVIFKKPGFSKDRPFNQKLRSFKKTVLFIKNPGFQKTVLFIKNPGFQKTVLFIKNPGF